MSLPRTWPLQPTGGQEVYLNSWAYGKLFLYFRLFSASSLRPSVTVGVGQPLQGDPNSLLWFPWQWLVGVLGPGARTPCGRPAPAPAAGHLSSPGGFPSPWSWFLVSVVPLLLPPSNSLQGPLMEPLLCCFPLRFYGHTLLKMISVIWRNFGDTFWFECLTSASSIWLRHSFCRYLCSLFTIFFLLLWRGSLCNI